MIIPQIFCCTQQAIVWHALHLLMKLRQIIRHFTCINPDPILSICINLSKSIYSRYKTTAVMRKATESLTLVVTGQYKLFFLVNLALAGTIMVCFGFTITTVLNSYFILGPMQCTVEGFMVILDSE